MEFNEATYDFFDDYLKGNLSEGDEGAFEDALSQDENVREEFSFYNSAVTAIQMSGSEIFKKQISEIGTAIPASAFEKYSPSIKPKNFFRKYWWAIAAASGIIAATLFFVLREHKNSANDEMKNNSDAPAIMDSAKTDTVQRPAGFGAPQDSCSDSTIKVKPDQQPARPGEKKPAMPKGFSENHCPILQVSIIAQPITQVFYGDEESKKQQYQALTNTWSNSWSKISVEFCPQNTKAPFYSYIDHLVICGSYVDSTDLNFYYPAYSSNGKSKVNTSCDTIIMLDSRRGNFILIRGAKNKNLIAENKAVGNINIPRDTFYEVNGRMPNRIKKGKTSK